jgi:hypothetical protein
MMLEHDEEAIGFYERYLVEVPGIPPEEATQIRADLATLRAGLSTIELTVRPSVAVTVTDTRAPVQGVPVSNTYERGPGPVTLRVRQGRHRIEVKSQGYLPSVLELDAQAGGRVDRTVTLAKPAAPVVLERSRPTPTTTYVLGAAAVAFTGVATVTGIMALGRQSDYGPANDGLHYEDAAGLHTEGRTLNVVTDVFAAGAVLAAVGAVVVYLTRPTLTIERHAIAPNGLRLQF